MTRRIEEKKVRGITSDERGLAMAEGVIVLPFFIVAGMGLVALHHLFVGMAFQADFRMEFPVLMGLGVTKRFDFMEVMAVVAGRGILNAGCNRFSVDGVAID